MQWFANHVNPYFIKNETKTTYKILKLRNLFVSWHSFKICCQFLKSCVILKKFTWWNISDYFMLISNSSKTCFFGYKRCTPENLPNSKNLCMNGMRPETDTGWLWFVCPQLVLYFLFLLIWHSGNHFMGSGTLQEHIASEQFAGLCT